MLVPDFEENRWWLSEKSGPKLFFDVFGKYAL